MWIPRMAILVFMVVLGTIRAQGVPPYYGIDPEIVANPHPGLFPREAPLPPPPKISLFGELRLLDTDTVETRSPTDSQPEDGAIERRPFKTLMEIWDEGGRPPENGPMNEKAHGTNPVENPLGDAVISWGQVPF